MRARWAGFAVGSWLLVAPLVLGYNSVGPVLHDVTLGLLVCVGTLAAIEWPLARLALLAPALWLVFAPSALGWGAPAFANDVACGVSVLASALVPGRRVAPAPAAAG